MVKLLHLLTRVFASALALAAATLLDLISKLVNKTFISGIPNCQYKYNTKLFIFKGVRFRESDIEGWLKKRMNIGRLIQKIEI